MIEKVQKILFVILLVFLGVLIFLSVPKKGLKDEYNWKGKSYSDKTLIEYPGEEEIIQALRQVIDPELGVDIVDLGLFYDVKMKEGDLDVVMTLTFKRCPFSVQIVDNVKGILTSIDGIKKIKLVMTFDPPWTWDRVSPEVRDEIIHNMHKLGLIEMVEEDGHSHE